MSPSVCSLPERTRRSPEIVLDVAREVAEGGEVEAVGDVGEREALVFEQVREFHGGVTVDPVVGRLAADALTDFREVLGRDAQLAGVPCHIAMLAVIAALQHCHEAVHHRCSLCRQIRLAVDARVELEEVNEEHLKHGNHLVAVKILVRMPHATEHLLEVVFAKLLLLLVEMHDGVDVERHSASCAVVGMCGADVDEVKIHIDDIHTKVHGWLHSCHLPIGYHNHAVALPEVKLAAAVPHLALARRAEGMGDIAFHTRLRDAIETIVDDDISLVEFHDAKL